MYKDGSYEANKGAYGEKKIKEILEKHYDEVKYFDFNTKEGHEMQVKGIDFSIKNFNWHREYYLDVKSNLINNSHFYLEIMVGDKQGWFHTSQSDRIYHYDVENDKYIWYDLKEMRKAYSINKLSHGNIYNGKDNSILLKLELKNFQRYGNMLLLNHKKVQDKFKK